MKGKIGGATQLLKMTAKERRDSRERRRTERKAKAHKVSERKKPGLLQSSSPGVVILKKK